MADRSSRSKKKSRGRARGTEVRKQPELRTGGGRQAKAMRSREREAAASRSAEVGPLVRIRPQGVPGFLLMLLVGYAGVALVVLGGFHLDRWSEAGTPASLWLYAAIGFTAAAPAVGAVARRSADVTAWNAQALLVPLGLLVGEAMLGQDCPDGGSCASIGARGSLGLIGSMVVVLALAAAAALLSRWLYERARDRRPASGRVRAGYAVLAMATTMLLVGVPVAAAVVVADLLVRDAPGRAQDARDYVAKQCLELGAATDLEVRPAPVAIYDGWTTFAVRRADEDRPAPGKGAKLPTDWNELDTVHPYEATVAYDERGQVALLACHKVDPASGAATAEDLKANTPDTASNPMDPKTRGSQFYPQFYSSGPHVPTAGEQAAAATSTAAAKRKTAAAGKAAAATPAK